MTYELPPGCTETMIRAVNSRHREDAIGEAWCAHLEGNDIHAAIRRFQQQEHRYEKAVIPLSQIRPDDTCTSLSRGTRRRSTRFLTR